MMRTLLDVVLGVGFLAFAACAVMASARKWRWRRSPRIPVSLSGLESLVYCCLALACVATAVWPVAGAAFIVMFILLGILQRRIDTYAEA